MSAVDVAIAVALALAASAGHKLGLLSRLPAWTGLALGITAAIKLLPRVVELLSDSSPSSRAIGAIAFVYGVSVLGQAIGFGLGSLIHANVRLADLGRSIDQAAGAMLGMVGTLTLVWLLVPAMAATPGWPARSAQDSAIMRFIDDVAPAPPRSIAAAVELVIGDAPFPEVHAPLDRPIPAGTPPPLSLSQAVRDRVAASVVKVEGEACNQVQDGSGWVAAQNLVVTNAHVVAGETRTSVHLPDGSRRNGTVVEFDPVRDLALVYVPRLGMQALPLEVGKKGDEGAVFGHPGGGNLRIAPARIAERIIAVGTDIYRTSATRRDVFVLASELRPGDSGAPLVNSAGEVTGVAFAIDPARSGTSYAVTDKEVREVLSKRSLASVATGDCLVD